MRKVGHIVLLVSLVAILVLSPSISGSAKYPTKEVEIIVPWSAGGATDLLFRAVAAVWPKHANGHPMLIKNVPGGGAVPGVVEFQKGRPDGYTLLGMATPIITKIHMSPVPFDVDSFEPVAMLVDNPCMIMVNTASPVKNLNDFIEEARRNPNAITVGNGGAGGGTHLAALAFEHFVGIELLHVPFPGGGPSVTAVVGNHVGSTMVSAPEGFPNVEAGQLRIIGIFGEERLPKFPDAPTAKEQGIDFCVTMWRGVCTQPNTPPEIVQAINDILVNCLKDPEFLEKAEELGIIIEYKAPKEFGEFMKLEDKRYEELIKSKKLGERYK